MSPLKKLALLTFPSEAATFLNRWKVQPIKLERECDPEVDQLRCVFVLGRGGHPGLPESAAEGLHQAHQESAQAGPQLQLQAHFAGLQERRQRQVSPFSALRLRGSCVGAETLACGLKEVLGRLLSSFIWTKVVRCGQLSVPRDYVEGS